MYFCKVQNNLSERDIKEYVIKRKISGSTRSENGRRCRDTFVSLKKPARNKGSPFGNSFATGLANETSCLTYHTCSHVRYKYGVIEKSRKLHLNS